MKNFDYKENAKDFIGYHITQYFGEPNFRTYIDYQIMSNGKTNVKTNFDKYKLGWEQIDKDALNYNEIYNEFFNCEEEEVYPRSNEDILSENDRIIESAQDPNFKIYHPNFEQELHKNSIMELGELEDLKENKNIQMKIEPSKPINKEENMNDILYAFGFIMILGWVGIGGALRYIINPEIPTWLILSILFVGFILVRRYYRYKE